MKTTEYVNTIIGLMVKKAGYEQKEAEQKIETDSYCKIIIDNSIGNQMPAEYAYNQMLKFDAI